MAFGLRVRKEDGTPRLDVTNRITRLAFSRIVDATASGAQVVPGLSTLNAFVTAQCLGSVDDTSCPHDVRIAGDIVFWTAQPAPSSGGDEWRVPSLILAFHFK